MRRAARPIAVLLLVGFALINVAAAFVYQYGQVDQTAPANVIIVLGGGTLPDGRPSSSTYWRTLHAVDLYKQRLAPQIICTGGFTGGNPVTEASACAVTAEAAGVPAPAIILEQHSTSTEENAIESRKIMYAHGFKTALLVSDQFHMMRAELLFHLYGMSVLRSPALPLPGFIEMVRTVEDTYREVAALAWLVFKSALHLPITSLKGNG